MTIDSTLPARSESELRRYLQTLIEPEVSEQPQRFAAERAVFLGLLQDTGSAQDDPQLRRKATDESLAAIATALLSHPGDAAAQAPALGALAGIDTEFPDLGIWRHRLLSVTDCAEDLSLLIKDPAVSAKTTRALLRVAVAAEHHLREVRDIGVARHADNPRFRREIMQVARRFPRVANLDRPFLSSIEWMVRDRRRRLLRRGFYTALVLFWLACFVWGQIVDS